MFKFNSLRTLFVAAALGAGAIIPGAALATGGENSNDGWGYGSGYGKHWDGSWDKPSGGVQDANQSAKGGDQTADQSNTAEVKQKQGNGNFNLSPAFAKDFGSNQCEPTVKQKKSNSNGCGGSDGPSATTKNAQGNYNDANARVGQDNAAAQSQHSNQDQSATSANSGYKGSEQKADQSAKGGDQSVDQSNDASVTQKQGNHNFNLGPALALGSGGWSGQDCGCWGGSRGDGQLHDDAAKSWNAQGNGNSADARVDQGNTAGQSQRSNQDQTVMSESGDAYKGKGGDQDASQSAKGGDQDITQGNTADVTQKQGNGNVNIAPAVALFGGDASTSNYQGNHNTANARVDQDNDATQSQRSNQSQDVSSDGGRGDQSADQSAKGGDQDANQSNNADVTQKQGNGNINIAPAISLFGGDASTHNAQGNGNDGNANVGQGNTADQSQTARQTSLVSSVLGGN